VIPEEWSIKNLGALGEPLIGLTYKPSNVKSDGLLVLRSSNIVDGTLRFDDNVFVDMEVPNRIIARKGDILICVRNGSRDLIGKCAKIDDRAQGMTFGAFMAVFRTPFHDFVYYQFQSEVIQRQIHAHLGATINQITNKSLRSFRVPFPEDDAEQRAIAAALCDVDALLFAMEKLIAKKRDLKQAAMQQFLTGQTRLPSFSGKWEVKRLGELVDLIPGGIYGEENPRGGLKAFRVATTAHIDETDTWNAKQMSVRYFTEEQISNHSPLIGDLIVVKSSGSAEKIQSGKIARISETEIGRFVFSNFLMLLRPKTVGSQFLFYYLTSFNVKKLLPTLVEASTYPNIRIDEYLALQIPLPGQREQTAIATVLSDMDAEIAALERRLAKTRALKQGMMQELLTGRTRLI